MSHHGSAGHLLSPEPGPHFSPQKSLPPQGPKPADRLLKGEPEGTCYDYEDRINFAVFPALQVSIRKDILLAVVHAPIQHPDLVQEQKCLPYRGSCVVGIRKAVGMCRACKSLSLVCNMPAN
eukprot:scaffold319910_cov21-Tisochrysis_lutea.AAC.1